MWRRIKVRGKTYALVPTRLWLHHPDYDTEFGSPCHRCPHFTYSRDNLWSSCSAMSNSTYDNGVPCAQRFRDNKDAAVFVPIELAVQLRLEE